MAPSCQSTPNQNQQSRKERKKLKDRLYYRQNKEKYKQRYSQNKDKFKEHGKKHYKQNKDKYKIYYIKNKEKINQYSRKYYEEKYKGSEQYEKHKEEIREEKRKIKRPYVNLRHKISNIIIKLPRLIHKLTYKPRITLTDKEHEERKQLYNIKRKEERKPYINLRDKTSNIIKKISKILDPPKIHNNTCRCLPCLEKYKIKRKQIEVCTNIRKKISGIRKKISDTKIYKNTYARKKYNNKICDNKKTKKFKITNYREYYKKYSKKYWELNKEKIKIHNQLRWKRDRITVISHYTNNLMCCNNCGITIFEFLSADHINGCDKYRNGYMSKSGCILYARIIKRNFPKDFQILCYNCNCAKHIKNCDINSPKYKVIQHYTDNKFTCNCCGKTETRYLTADHINGGGNKHRRDNKIGDIYRWLIKNNFPKDFQILCYNCNYGRDRSNKDKICPHKIQKQKLIISENNKNNPCQLLQNMN